MTMHTPPPALMIPETAPFSPEQRAWLSGYFAALLAPDAAAMPLPLGIGVDVAGPPEPAAALADAGDAPWHDPSLPIDQRMTMAEGRPLAPRLMAAMAQQDCGQCGYNCADYANALFLKKEERLSLCAPGGKETLRMLRKLAGELENAKAEAKPTAPAATPATAPATASPETRGRSREQPVEAIFLSRRRLNAASSEKETWHIEIDLTECGLDYSVGDSLGVFPVNAPSLVDAVIAQLGARPERMIGDMTFRERLVTGISLGPAPDALFQLLSYVTGGEQRRKAQALAAGDDPDGDAAQLDVLAALHKFPAARPDAEAFLETLDVLQPRLYSISSSPKACPGRVSLTVDAVRYALNKRLRLGVASTFFAERLELGAAVNVYVQKAHGFALPADPATPVIMVGPGTGIAPFRAFLQERAAIGAAGKNWLFFGHQRQDADFFYKDELTAMKEAGLLTRLTLAWSREGPHKIYVQDRMREVGPDLWQWLAQGAHFYVCGDAKRMAKDVETALVDVVAKHGARSIDEAVAFVQALKRAGRYQADVY
jgi:sulfite reductase (NADPH) flavoprotein alpha-component